MLYSLRSLVAFFGDTSGLLVGSCSRVLAGDVSD